MDMNVDPGRERSRLRDALRYHPVLVALMSVMGLLLGLGLAALVPSPDTASTTVLLRPLPGNPYSSVNEPDTLVALETEAQLVRSDEVSRRVIRDLDLGVTAAELRSNLTTSVPDNTQVLEIEYTGNAEDATKIAQAYADQYLAFRESRGEAARDGQVASLDAQISDREAALDELEAQPDGAARSASIARATSGLLALQAQRDAIGRSELDAGEVIVPARTAPAGLTILSLALPLLGLLAGAGLGLVLAVTRERSAGVLRHTDDLDEYGVPLLSVVPAERAADGGLSRDQQLAVRGLATVLHRQPAETSVVAVMSADPAVPAAPLADHAARVLTSTGRPARAVDASRIVVGEGTTGVQAVWSLIDAGAAGAAPAVAGSPLRLVATAPGGRPEADAAVEAADGVVLLVQLGQTREHDLERSLSTAQYLGSPVIGVVALAPGATLPAVPTTTEGMPGGRHREAEQTDTASTSAR
jgi:hypothetical protein